jgi:NodT family efflux transporter outer membrane factor (OMF) lipoprotein
MVRGAGGIAAAWAVTATLLTGCAVGPDFAPPSAPNVSGYSPAPLAKTTASAATAGGASQTLVRSLDLPGQWWALFHSKDLNSLVEQALAANADIEAAQAALSVARQNVYAQQGALFPSANANFSANRQEFEISQPSDVAAGPQIFNLFTAQSSISYTPDVFGGTRRSIEALQAQADSQRFALEATYLTLTSNLAGAAVQEASLRGQIAATQRMIKIESDVLTVMQRQFKLGDIAESDVLAQQVALAQLEQTLPPLQKQVAQERDLIAALCGGLPSDKFPQHFAFATLQLPRDLPVSLPSQLAEQRPDVRAAEANLQAASALIGVAVANRLPNITLSGEAGSTALGLNQLFTPGFNFWSITDAVTQPVFDGGTLLHRELAAKAAFRQAAAQYRSTVITAFQNVADTLHAIYSDAILLQKAVASERAASKNLDITRKRMELGDINYLALLNAQQTYQQALLGVVQAEASRYADTVALFQALGGGWWNRADAQPEPPLAIVDIFH